MCGNKQGLLGSELAQCYSCHTSLVKGSLKISPDSRWGSRLHIFMGGDAMPHCRWPGYKEGWRILAIFAKKTHFRVHFKNTESLSPALDISVCLKTKIYQFYSISPPLSTLIKPRELSSPLNLAHNLYPFWDRCCKLRPLATPFSAK